MATPTTSRRARAGAFMLAVAAASLAAGSPIYRSVDSHGRVTFSDVAPAPGARALTLAPGNRYRPRKTGAPARIPPAVPQVGARGAGERQPHPVIVSPRHDAAVRSNNGALTVAGLSEPALAPSHRAELSLDGAVVARGRELTFDLTNLDRGTHELILRIVDAQGRRIAASRPIVFHLLRARRSNAP